MSNQITEDAGSSAKKAILLAAEQQLRSLGGPVPIMVRYVNRTKGSLSFREPAKTWEVHLLVGRPAEDPKEVPFGRIFSYRKGDLARWTIEDAETITLAPGATYDFKYDLGKRWPELFAPGVNLVRIKDRSDDSETVFSNTLEIRVACDRSTFPYLLAIASDEQSSVDSCRFAAEWIRRLYPGFQLATGEITDSDRTANRKHIGEAQSWWDAHASDAAVLQQIEKLNSEKAAPAR